MVNPNNNVSEINKNLRIYEVYPLGKTSFTEYDDDGISEQYKAGKGHVTIIESNLIKDKAVVTVFPAKGNFEGQIKEKKLLNLESVLLRSPRISLLKLEIKGET